MKKKKLIVALSSLVVIVGLFVLLSFTAFSLRTVEVDFRTSAQNLTATQEEIIETSGIKKGGTVFFRNKDKYEGNIEKAYPYIKVINIETVFPNKMIVHVAERQEVYALEGENEFYVCDEEFKVLNVVQALDDEDAILLKTSKKISAYQAGQYITEIENPKIYQALYENNRSLGAQKEFISSIEMEKEYDEGVKEEVDVLRLSLSSGQTVTIANYKKDLSKKAHLMFEVYSSLFDMAGKESLQEDGSMAELTIDNLKTCEIYINNYYTGENLKENCYFKIFV